MSDDLTRTRFVAGMNSVDSIRDADGKLPAFAWPGGYPIAYYDTYASALCPACANDDTCDPPVIAYDIHFEGPPIICESCNGEIESAYGDPDEERREEAKELLTKAVGKLFDRIPEADDKRVSAIVEELLNHAESLVNS